MQLRVRALVGALGVFLSAPSSCPPSSRRPSSRQAAV